MEKLKFWKIKTEMQNWHSEKLKEPKEGQRILGKQSCPYQKIKFWILKNLDSDKNLGSKNNQKLKMKIKPVAIKNYSFGWILFRTEEA